LTTEYKNSIVNIVAQLLKLIKRALLVSLFLILMGLFFAPKTHATMTNVSDTITTSQPSGATPIISSITASHIIQLTPGTTIPSGGKIVITFQGTGSNIASPSVTGFSFNNLAAGVVICNPTTACSGGVSVASPAITIITGAVQSGPIYIAIGCTGTLDVSGGVGSCSTYAPALINPAVSSNATCTGTGPCAADIWKVLIQTKDSTGIVLETTRVAIGIINGVQFQATVEPTLTFSIAGVANGVNWATLVNACGNESISTSFDTTATTVNLGSLSSSNFNKTAQVLTVSTNSPSGYSLTAASSGHLINTDSGAWLPDANGGNGLTANNTPAPVGIKNVSGSAFFGISPCGFDVPSMWGGANQITNNSNFSNPWNTGINAYSATLASYTGGPVNGDQTHGETVVRYAAGVSDTTPAGVYKTVFTYMASVSF
jgi:hypothetical protein